MLGFDLEIRVRGELMKGNAANIVRVVRLYVELTGTPIGEAYNMARPTSMTALIRCSDEELRAIAAECKARGREPSLRLWERTARARREQQAAQGAARRKASGGQNRAKRNRLKGMPKLDSPQEDLHYIPNYLPPAPPLLTAKADAEPASRRREKRAPEDVELHRRIGPVQSYEDF